MLLGAPGLTTRSKKLVGTKGIVQVSKALSGDLRCPSKRARRMRACLRILCPLDGQRGRLSSDIPD